MISADKRHVTVFDREAVLRINPEEYNTETCYVTDGKYLYYVDGYTEPQEIRALNDEEQLIVIDEIARIKGKTREKIFSFMLKQNKDVDYQNIPENDFNSKAEVDAWWKNKDEATIYKVFDEYYGIAEYIANEC
jgi:hypothetical protein